MLGRPTVFGPHTDNFAAIARLLLNARASVQIRGVSDMVDAVGQWLEDPDARRLAGRRAIEVVEREGGATAKVVAMIDATLAQRPRSQNPEYEVPETEDASEG